MTATNVANRKAPPSPSGHPLWGNLFEFRRNQLDFVHQVSRKYGGMVQIKSLFSNDYVITEPGYIQHVLIDHKNNYTNQSFEYTAAERFFGHSLFILEGAAWARQHRLLQPIFHRGRVLQLAPIIQECITTRLAHWEAAAQHGALLDIEREMRHLTLLIAGQVIFSSDFSEQINTITQIFDTVNEQGDLAQNAFSLGIPWLPTRANRRYEAAIRQLDEIVYGQIAEHRSLLAAGGQIDEMESDLLTQLILACDEQGKALTDTELRDEITTFLFDSSETTSNALAWTWWLLGQHPAAMQTLQRELQGVLQGHAPSMANLGQLPYTHMCYQEALRLYPPSHLISRRAVQDDEIGGYYIPAKSNLVINIYGVQRHPAWWSNPDAFEPARFDDKQVARRHKLAFMPFGAGPRMCIGYQFSTLEAQLILATVAQRFQLQLMSDHAVEPEVLLSLRPKQGFLMQVQPV